MYLLNSAPLFLEFLCWTEGWTFQNLHFQLQKSLNGSLKLLLPNEPNSDVVFTFEYLFAVNPITKFEILVCVPLKECAFDLFELIDHALLLFVQEDDVTISTLIECKVYPIWK